MAKAPEKTRPRLFLIDGYALIYRAFFAMISRPLTTSKGENTSAAFGFTRFILKVLQDYQPDYLGVVLDSGDSQRTEIFPEYKATREKMPDELRSSLPRVRSLVEAFRIPILELEDHEADDIIGTLAARASEAGVETVIVSGDKDFYQLIGDGVALLNPGRGGQANVDEEWVDARNASERLGVPPERVCDYLALIGDSSDNVPGARGIGPKTAIKLIEEYGSVEEILARAEEVGGKRARESLLENRDNVLLSKRLVTIMRDLPVQLDLDALAVGEPDRERLKQLFAELEFHGLVREIAAPEPETAKLRAEYGVVESPAQARDLAARIRDRGRVAIWAVGSSTDGAMRAELVGLALAFGPGQAWYLPLTHRARTEVLELGLDDAAPPDAAAAEENLPALTSPDMKPLRAALEDAAVGKTGHDLKYALVLLRRAGVELRGVAFDAMLASYLIEPGRRDQELGSLALQHLGHSAMAYEDLCGKGRDATPVAECELDRVRDYACEKADIAARLRERLEPQLGEYHLEALFRDIEMPLIEVLAEMEQAGIGIDLDFFREVSTKLERDLALIQEEIWKEAGEEFNINSTLQLREILFEKLELPVLKKTKTGASTDASVLEELAAEGHRLPTLLLEYRQLEKLRGTYVDALPILVNPRTGRLHTSFNQAVAATGRLSSTDPNLQNIPIRTEVGAELRKGFVAGAGHLFLSADYSQIELRVLAHLSGDATFTEAFRSGADIHKRTAALVFAVESEEQVTPRMRGAAKTINFATIYGIGPFALSKQLGTTVAEAKTFIESYFERLPDVRKYLDRQIERAYEEGYVETLAGRRRYIPEVRSKNYNIRQFGERAATNAPVQGSAADIIKIAMVRIHRALRQRRSGSGGEGAGRGVAGTRMLLQVHDELLFEVPEAEMEAVTRLVREEMEGAFELAVPLKVETGVGRTWYDCK
ncbi:MAG TPA: DNA polymerase I [Longimicrobiales bacterium]|nr:DNA polymerase I [Longimicrobiales bacterium]